MRPSGTRMEPTLGAKARERRRGPHPESSRTPGMEVSGTARRAVDNGGGHGGRLPAPVARLHSHRHPPVPSHAPRHCSRQHLEHPPVRLVQRMPHSRHCPRSGLRHTPLATTPPVAAAARLRSIKSPRRRPASHTWLPQRRRRVFFYQIHNAAFA